MLSAGHLSWDGIAQEMHSLHQLKKISRNSGQESCSLINLPSSEALARARGRGTDWPNPSPNSQPGVSWLGRRVRCLGKVVLLTP